MEYVTGLSEVNQRTQTSDNVSNSERAHSDLPLQYSITLRMGFISQWWGEITSSSVLEKCIAWE